jgi:hypothetical protein
VRMSFPSCRERASHRSFGVTLVRPTLRCRERATLTVREFGFFQFGHSTMAACIERPVGFCDAFQSDEQAATALQYPTDLKALSEKEFDALARHGFEVADITMTTYAPVGFPRSLQWEDKS